MVILLICGVLQVFRGQEYVSPATLSKNVPMLVCGGIGKKFMIPGWRLGWILIHDRNGAFKDEVKPWNGVGLDLCSRRSFPCILLYFFHSPHTVQSYLISIPLCFSSFLPPSPSFFLPLPLFPLHLSFFPLPLSVPCFPSLFSPLSISAPVLCSPSLLPRSPQDLLVWQ